MKLKRTEIAIEIEEMIQVVSHTQSARAWCAACGREALMATPQQAYVLWKHWGEPRICWYAGSHVGYVWSGEVRRFVEEIHTGGMSLQEGE